LCFTADLVSGTLSTQEVEAARLTGQSALQAEEFFANFLLLTPLRLLDSA
jgi:hypothetical protein